MAALNLESTNPELWTLHRSNPRLAEELSANEDLRSIVYGEQSVVVKLRRVKNLTRQLPTNHPSASYHRAEIRRLEQQQFQIKRIFKACDWSTFFVTVTSSSSVYSERVLIRNFQKLLHSVNRSLYSHKKHLYLTGYVVFEGHSRRRKRCDPHFHAFLYVDNGNPPETDRLLQRFESRIHPQETEDDGGELREAAPQICDHQGRPVFDSVKIRQLEDTAYKTIDYSCKNLLHPDVTNADPEFGLGLYEIRKGKLVRA